jgi:hypothetical protein
VLFALLLFATKISSGLALLDALTSAAADTTLWITADSDDWIFASALLFFAAFVLAALSAAFLFFAALSGSLSSFFISELAQLS